ncbi:unnamed protein product [Hermetia illucens]|uniref:Uncharacterized protein n=1 Tax=Hermetia illucens TaxID=343691 RepID=A0A7R8Z4Y2_HERIL|nr:unnamed protein product [Hermetia illucens]
MNANFHFNTVSSNIGTQLVTLEMAMLKMLHLSSTTLNCSYWATCFLTCVYILCSEAEITEGFHDSGRLI